MALRNIYIAATGQHAGKSSLCLGMACFLGESGVNVGYCKPVGQRHIEVNGRKAERDAFSIVSALGHRFDVSLHSPVVVDGGYTASYLAEPRPEAIRRQILRAADELSRRHTFVVYEGTGHAGVGSVIDHSNADVAALLGAQVILVAEGGIGNTIDRLCVAKAFFDRAGVPIAGALINKLKAEKREKVSRALETGLKRKGIPLLGVVPFDEVLAYPQLAQIAPAVGAEVINEGKGLNRLIRLSVFGVSAETADTSFQKGEILLVSPIDHVDTLFDSLAKIHVEGRKDFRIGGVLLTAGKEVPDGALDLFIEGGTPVLSTSLDTYTVACRLHDLVAKLEPDAEEKISVIKRLYREYASEGVSRVIGPQRPSS